jgi:hypothetical protein
MTNKTRGEAEIALDGKTYTLRLSFQALCRIEEGTGLRIGTMLRRFAEGDLGARDMAVVIHAGMHAFDERAPSLDEVGRMVVDEGIAALAAPVGAFLANAISGNRSGAKKESKP